VADGVVRIGVIRLPYSDGRLHSPSRAPGQPSCYDLHDGFERASAERPKILNARNRVLEG